MNAACQNDDAWSRACRVAALEKGLSALLLKISTVSFLSCLHHRTLFPCHPRRKPPPFPLFSPCNFFSVCLLSREIQSGRGHVKSIKEQNQGFFQIHLFALPSDLDGEQRGGVFLYPFY